jgi:hypothetical protein
MVVSRFWKFLEKLVVIIFKSDVDQNGTSNEDIWNLEFGIYYVIVINYNHVHVSILQL